MRMIRRGALSNQDISTILDMVLDDKLSKKGAMDRINEASELPLSESQIDELIETHRRFKQSASSTRYKVGQKNTNPDKYDLAVQKMISYKGTIRPMTLDVKSPGGGTYKLRVVNIYVKPNFIKRVFDAKTQQFKDVQKDNIRVYEEKVYTVNKGDIAKGSSTDNYYPDKARWSKPPEKREKPQSTKSAETAKEEDILQLRRKRKSRISTRRLLKKTTKRNIRCKCKNIKKR